MEWVLDNWYYILLGLIAVMYLFGYRSNGRHEDNPKEHQHGLNSGGQTHKGCGGCH